DLDSGAGAATAADRILAEQEFLEKQDAAAGGEARGGREIDIALCVWVGGRMH
ncbi:hypothetical protein MNEG_16215, partial [Monoraphidium neglectum]